MKIFIGFVNIASQFNDLKTGFKKLGVDTFTVTRYQSSVIVNNETDLDLYKLKTRINYMRPSRIFSKLRPWWYQKTEDYVFKKALKECDCFIFFWDTFFHDHSDLKLLKEKNKKVISVFVGDDIRWYYSMKQEFEMYKMYPIEYDSDYDYSVNALEKRLSLLRTAEKYSDFIFSRLDQGQLHLRPYYRWNMMVDPNKFVHSPSQREKKPIVAHAPSTRAGKGTKHVLEAFKRLKNEGVEFEEMLIENVPNDKAIHMYGNADILIDQLYCPGAGKLSTEALACGTIVMSNMSYDVYPQKTPGECPIMDINPDTIYARLKELILNYEFRKAHALKGRPYVEKYLDINIFCEKVVNLLNGKKYDPDYTPDFFAKHFVPESQDSGLVYDKWTSYVKDCGWYKQSEVLSQ